MIIRLGTDKTAPSINMLHVCFWKVIGVIHDQAIYLITFAGGSELTLSKDESIAFDQFLQQSSQQRLIQPVSSGGILLQ